jgi:hypothetical protein
VDMLNIAAVRKWWLGAGSIEHRWTRGLILLALLGALSFGAIVKTAFAVSYHTTCVGHGVDQGGSLTDGSFFSRVAAGCGSSNRICDLYVYGGFVGGSAVAGTTATCSAWSRNYGDYTECAGSAHVDDPGVFSRHAHNVDNWCG